LTDNFRDYLESALLRGPSTAEIGGGRDAHGRAHFEVDDEKNSRGEKWCPGAESNHRRRDFQPSWQIIHHYPALSKLFE